MNRHLIINHFVFYGRLQMFILVTFWLLGVCFGVGLVYCYPPLITQGLQTGLLANQSVSGFLITVAPLLLLVVLLWCGQRLMVFPLVLTTGISRGYTAYLIFLIFGSSGWLIRLFLLFSVGCVSVLFWWFVLRHTQFRKPSFTTDTLIASAFLIVIFAVERLLISPYLLQITKYL